MVSVDAMHESVRVMKEMIKEIQSAQNSVHTTSENLFIVGWSGASKQQFELNVGEWQDDAQKLVDLVDSFSCTMESQAKLLDGLLTE
ncbi:MAG: WXG100 family type VII secretion target, partial [Clostridia bacterium]|nr:WXG100 family type VII secretion target [Clostridia bacterium]